MLNQIIHQISFTVAANFTTTPAVPTPTDLDSSIVAGIVLGVLAALLLIGILTWALITYLVSDYELVLLFLVKLCV